MKETKDIKRTSLYIPLDFFAKVQKSADIHRRSFNQQLLWLAEQGMDAAQKNAHASESSMCVCEVS